MTVGEAAPLIVGNGAGGVTSGIEAPQRVYVFGLASEIYPPISINQVYDPEFANWTLATAMPTSRVDFGVAVINDTMYAVGGIVIAYYYDETGKYIEGSSGSLTDVNEQYIPMGYGTILPSPTVSPPASSVSGIPEQPISTLLTLIVAVAIILTVLLAIFFRWKSK